MKTAISKALILVLLVLFLIPSPVYTDELGLDYPHCSTYDLGCLSCHYMFDDFFSLGWPSWVTHERTDIDDTPYNNLCWSCHNDITAADVNPHSSLTTTNQYGDWSIECRTCHDPHHQMQLWTYGAQSYNDTGTSTSITFNTLTKAGAGWTDNQYQGYTLVPNLDELSYNYRITGNTGDILTIDGYMNKREEDFEQGDFSAFSWSTGGDADWTVQNTTKYAGEYAAEAPTSLGDNQTSYFQVRLKITAAGNISFWYKVSSESGDDYLRFLIDGEEQDSWSGEVDWTQDSYAVSAAWHTFRWEYIKGVGGSEGNDTAWIDDIIFPTRETATVGDSFAIIYGNLIRDEISSPNSGNKTVKFINAAGDNSFADGDSTYDGVCEICHTQPSHFRNDGGGTDQVHTNIGGGQAGVDCIDCHSHENGFGHGGGGGTGCGTSTSCHGLVNSHPMHVATGGMGAPLECSGCHDETNFPKFTDGEQNLSNTTVCDNCHSPYGSFDGVDDSVIGAKANWETGVYEVDNTLKSGKDKWCAGCHDEAPGNSQGDGTGVDAPNVVGDEDGSYIYGTGWGFYKTGHGLSTAESYPSSGGVSSGAGIECGSCHDFSLSHIDHEARSFGCSDGCDADEYRQGYRLKLVSSQNPMYIPLSTGPVNSADQFRLCYSCHNSGPYLDPNNMNTNLKTECIGTECDDYPDGVNRHEYHLRLNYQLRYRADYDYSEAANSRMTCVNCHNVHGTTQLVMVRDGKLIDREPGLKIWYNNDDIVTYSISNPDPPDPENLPLSASTGTVWRGKTSSNLCSHCHNNNNTIPEYRTPFQDVAQAPQLSWTGEANYATNGVHPDSGLSGSSFEFRIKYTDNNNDAPSEIQVWVDLNDNSSYEAGEKYAMTVVDGGDNNYIDGKLYTRSLVLSKAGDDVLNYRFYASDGSEAATGSPVSDSTVTITNNAPQLDWTGEVNYTTDGVNPNSNPSGSSFEFRVKYSDPDNEPPSSIEVWVDINDNSSYEAGEKYAMTEVDGGDTTYTDGKLYTRTLTLSYTGDGIFDYRFYSTEGIDDATGGGTFDITVSVSSGPNNVPILAWTGETNYISDGVDPDSGPASMNFEFRIKYTDDDNDAPTSIQIWLDENDNSLYEAGEKYDMTQVDANDIDCSDGKLYSKTLQPVYAGDGSLFYRFYAYDGSAVATGNPIADKTLPLTDSLVVPDEYATINLALSYAVAGDIILVKNGTYPEKIDLDNRDITIQSQNGASVTIIDGGGSGGSIVKFRNGDSSTLAGFTVQNGCCGTGNYGGGLYMLDSSPTIEDCIITGNSTIQWGGGISAANSSPTITNTTISNNSTTQPLDGGGFYLTGSSSSSTVQSCTFSGNTARSGAGIMVRDGASITINDTSFNSNICNGSGEGGGLFVSGTSSSATIDGSTFSGNTGRYGGGISAVSSALVTITGSTINSNTCSSLDGAGLYIRDSELNISKCVISGNSGARYGGGINLTTSGVVTTATIVNCTISGNSAERESYSDGGGLYINGSTTTATITNCSLSGNKTARWGGGILATNSASVTVKNSILWGDSAGTSGNERYSYNSGSITFSYTDIDEDGYAGSNGNIRVNPSFVNQRPSSEAPTTAGDYHIQLGSPCLNMGTGTGAPTDDIDDDSRPQSTGIDMGSDELVSANSVPTLAWTGETNYISDGVNPDYASSGSNFEFRINYTDLNNEAPTTIQVWVDENDNSTYEIGEKYDLIEVDSVDAFFTDGKLYTKTLALAKAGDGILNYRFYASDGIDDATGTPTSDNTVTVNVAPSLDWTGETNYVGDGVNPNIADDGSNFEFRIDYTDADNDAPSSIQVWVDINDNSSYEVGEKYAMTEVDGGDTTYTDGKRYTKTLTLSHAGDGNLNYRFYASDGSEDATGGPTSDNMVTVNSLLNNGPTLAWTGETNYTGDGVDPDSGAGGSNFTFRIQYTDIDNDAPTSIQVWVDKNDNSDYNDTGEKIDMTEVDAGDTDYTDGKLYTTTIAIPYAGDGDINYRFDASDGSAGASGPPTSNSVVTVVDPLEVPGEYASIQDAITAASNGDIILVVANTYSENIDYGSKVITIQGAGAATTKIQGTGANAPVVTFANSALTSSTVLDGFTIDNQASANTATRGISITGSAAPTLKNLIVVGNNVDTGWVDGAGIYINGATATIESCTIGGNASNKNTGDKGAGIYAENLSGALSITGSTISHNQTGGSGRGAGIYLLNNTTYTTTISNSTISDNFSYDHGGAIYVNSSKISITGSTISNNTVNDSGQQGGAVYLTGASSSMVLSSTDVSGNTTPSRGGAIYMYGSTEATPLSITGGSFTSNTASSEGGAIYLNAMTNASTISGVSFTSNEGSKGGAIYSVGSALTITNSAINSNTSSFEGGGIYLNGAAAVATITGGSVNGNSATNGGGVYIVAGADLTITGATVNSNTCSGNVGGGIDLVGGSLTLNKVYVQGNQAPQRGGGLYVGTGTTAEITNSIISGNTVGSGVWEEGGGIRNYGTLTIYNSTIVGNWAPKGGGLYTSGTANIKNSIFWDNVAGTSVPEISGTAAAIYTDVEGGFTGTGTFDGDSSGTGNINSNPDFITTAQAAQGSPTTGGNFHINSGSPVINQGKSSGAGVPSDDIDGDTRSIVDMGADEL